METTAPTTTEDTPCAGVGNGYWLCDVLGGCPDCRHLAACINDAEQFDAWADAADAADKPLLAEKRRRTAARFYRTMGG